MGFHVSRYYVQKELRSAWWEGKKKNFRFSLMRDARADGYAFSPLGFHFYPKACTWKFISGATMWYFKLWIASLVCVMMTLCVYMATAFDGTALICMGSRTAACTSAHMWKAYCLEEVAEKEVSSRARLRPVHMPCAGMQKGMMWLSLPWKF